MAASLCSLLVRRSPSRLSKALSSSSSSSCSSCHGLLVKAAFSLGSSSAASLSEAPDDGRCAGEHVPVRSSNGARSSFVEIQEKRMQQADRSVLISCPKSIAKSNLLQFLSNHGHINNYFFYESYGMYMLVEFADKNGAQALCDAGCIPHTKGEFPMPFRSRVLAIRPRMFPNAASAQPTSTMPETDIHIINREPVSNKDIISRLNSLESTEQQLRTLVDMQQLTDADVRLRFMVCSLLQDMCATIFPGTLVRPFGSSINSFGHTGCDLDMLLDLDGVLFGNKRHMVTNNFELDYQVKMLSSERSVTQSVLSVMGECLDYFSPGCVGVQKILQARCPLVRFSHQPSSLQCDFTANNRIALKSTEMLYIYGQVDERVRQLVFAVRSWARSHGLTSSISGAWITNFALTTMVLFFLQKRSPPIVPTLEQLRKLADPEDVQIVEGHDCTIVSNLEKITSSQNTETLDELLVEFFNFYGSFSFSKHSINIWKGSEQNKPESSPLYIVNPFEQHLNISKNVNVSQLERFVQLARNSVWQLQHQEKQSSPKNRPWGLTAVMSSQLQSNNTKGRGRMKSGETLSKIRSLLENSLLNKAGGNVRKMQGGSGKSIKQGGPTKTNANIK
ncbi:poly(A) RNA polymerase, mitochondrial-like [Lethenteron reissneri]|uniref:poly(A) RNA polymerase, mitochondrial-like n=1 Tax=Lethenteron reissneri TaxID=7753 RepID=UPI002AB7EB99|nr:poly(A) RNA polymerase, mitochondrial-like [Lethenteron reissneri]